MHGFAEALQNAALHVYCRQLAHALNTAGIDMRVFFESREKANADWTDYGVKNHIWRPIQEAMTGEQSTTRPKRKEYPEIYEVLNRFLSETWPEIGHAPWPSEDNR